MERQMTLARLKTPAVEVWQYWKYNPMTAPWVYACTERRGDELYLDRRSGKQLIRAGEWLIRNLDGDPIWMDDQAFRATYELVR
jgi:hypothetical protein